MRLQLVETHDPWHLEWESMRVRGNNKPHFQIPNIANHIRDYIRRVLGFWINKVNGPGNRSQEIDEVSAVVGPFDSMGRSGRSFGCNAAEEADCCAPFPIRHRISPVA
jgi:hypothetical protein